jgi:hypothetical protein
MNARTIVSSVAMFLVTVSISSAESLTPESGSTTVVEGGSVTVNSVVWWADMGEKFGNGRAYVVPILLPTLPAGTSFADVDLAFGHHGPGSHPIDSRSGFFGGNAPNYNIDLYGLQRVATDALVLAADHYSGPSDAASTLLQDAYLDPDSPGNRTVIHTNASGDAALALWLNDMYAGGANAGKYVFLRLNPDGVDGTLPWSGYQVMTAGAGGADEKPVLSYSIVPEPSGLILLGFGLLAWRRR